MKYKEITKALYDILIKRNRDNIFYEGDFASECWFFNNTKKPYLYYGQPYSLVWECPTCKFPFKESKPTLISLYGERVGGWICKCGCIYGINAKEVKMIVIDENTNIEDLRYQFIKKHYLVTENEES